MCECRAQWSGVTAVLAAGTVLPWQKQLPEPLALECLRDVAVYGYTSES